jgi:hypothetical protein
MKKDAQSVTLRHATGSNATARISGREKPMSCTEFQKDLPLIIDTGGTQEHAEHLRTCDTCRDLVNDLRYIAEQAKLLVSMNDPSPRVWAGIEEKLKHEGLLV